MANIKADEISKILREQIENYEQTVAVEEVGSVISVGDGIARVYGLEKVMSGEMIAFPHNVSASRSTFRKTKWAPCCSANTTPLKKATPSSARTRLCPCLLAKPSWAAS